MSYKHKRSDVPGKVPVAADFKDGEILVNTADGRAFINTPDGVKTLPNTGDIPPPNTANVGAAIAAASGKQTPADSDFFAGVASGGSTMFKTTWGNIKAALKAYFDTIYQAALGFTPVQQGGGTGQSTNKLRIGWLGNSIGFQVDGSNYGDVWPINITGYASSANTIGGKSVQAVVAETVAGTLGAYALLRWGGSTSANPNTATPGSNLSYTNGKGENWGSPPQGSWRLMSGASVADDQGRLSLWLRYA